MNSKKTEKLFQKYPDLFNQDSLVYGFECQDGWFDILTNFAEQIRHYRSDRVCVTKFEIIQVKQKMGALRIYANGCDAVIRSLIEEAEEQSQSVCELDGEPAIGLFVCAPEWYRHLCERCAGLHGCMTMEDYHQGCVERTIEQQNLYI